MSRPVFRLKVPETWCECPNHRLTYFADPMDRRDYNEMTAFPLLKPDPDVLDDIIPQRSNLRRRRGWYHVATWPRRHPAQRDPKNKSPLRSREVPEELFSLILSKYTLNRRSNGRVSITRHDLALLGRINRYWADRCQRKLFAHVSLGSHEEACELLELVQSPSSRIVKYMGSITIEAQTLTPPSVPWVHLLCYVFGAEERYLAAERLRQSHNPPQKVRSPTIKLALNGPGTLGRSIHHGLPPSHPPNFSWPIGHLMLTSVKFRRFADFLAVTAYMTNLHTVECVDVHWADAPQSSDGRDNDVQFRFTAFGHPPNNTNVSMERCSIWPRYSVAPFLKTKWIGRRWAFRNLAPGELDHMDELTEAIFSGCTASESRISEIQANCRDWDTDGTVLYEAEIERRCSYSLARTGVSIVFKCRGNLVRTNGASGGTVRMTALVLSLPPRSTAGGWNGIDWAEVNTKLRVCSSIRTLIVGFACQDDMRYFKVNVANKYLSSFASKLRMVIWNSSGGAMRDGSWSKVSPVKDTEGAPVSAKFELEDSGVPVLKNVYGDA